MRLHALNAYEDTISLLTKRYILIYISLQKYVGNDRHLFRSKKYLIPCKFLLMFFEEMDYANNGV